MARFAGTLARLASEFRHRGNLNSVGEQGGAQTGGSSTDPSEGRKPFTAAQMYAAKAYAAQSATGGWRRSQFSRAPRGRKTYRSRFSTVAFVTRICTSGRASCRQLSLRARSRDCWPVVRAGSADPGHFVGKGWLKLEFASLTLPGGTFPLSAKVVSVPHYRVKADGTICGRGHARRDTVEWAIPVRFDNEMNRFRYNAILHLDTARDGALELPFLDCAEQRFTLDSIAALLRNKNPDFLAIKNVTCQY
jgi:hypothetical protein